MEAGLIMIDKVHSGSAFTVGRSADETDTGVRN